jgi:adenosylcobyric acid synthase
MLDIVVVDLPHLSNFTDFDALRVEPGLRLRFVHSATEAGVPALLVLPGSKSVIADLEFIRQNGWHQVIERIAAAGNGQIAGICGGLQMLGTRIYDPHGLESCESAVSGLGLLPIETTLERESMNVKAIYRELGLA